MSNEQLVLVIFFVSSILLIAYCIGKCIYIQGEISGYIQGILSCSKEMDEQTKKISELETKIKSFENTNYARKNN